MRMLFPRSARMPALQSGALCVLLATFIAGCASKNPLMDEPANARRSQDATPVQTAQDSGAASDLQVTREKPFLGFLHPYRPDIQQGNFISHEMIAQIKEGMTPDQVRFILGTPLLTDVFHADRWDYPFRIKKGNGEVTTSRVTLIFVDNRLARIEGGDLPTEADYLARIAGSKPGKAKAESPAPPAAPSSSANPQSPATTKP